jgi:hypothetical protein
MFKITGRIVLILLAASLVSGMLYWLVNGTAGQPGLLASLDRRGGFGSGFRRTANGQSNLSSVLTQGVSSLAFRATNFSDGGFRNRLSLARGLSGVVGDLIVVALITVLVVLVHGVIKKALSHPPEKAA